MKMSSCVAYGCINSNSKGAASNLHFHRFPFHNPSLLAKWTSVIGRDNWTPTKQSCLCSDHFTSRDYKSPNSGSLKDTAVPSKFKRLPSSRVKKAEQQPSVKEVVDKDVSKAKPPPARRSTSQLTKDSPAGKKGKTYEKRSQPLKGKKKEILEDSLETILEDKPVNGHQVQKNEVSVKLEENLSASNTGGNQQTPQPDDKSVVTTEEGLSRNKTKQSRLATKSAESKLMPSKPKKPRARKILRLSSDESEGEVEVMWASGRRNTVGADRQISSDEVLAAVRVELDENELSDSEQPVNVFDKWMENETGNNAVRATPSFTSSLPGGQNIEDQQKKQKKPLCTIPADMDHLVAVNERRTRYRYIYRVGQCFPEEDDDVPFIKSKLSFVIKALQSQNDKVRALKKRCRELSRSNSTLRDILGIQSTDNNDELTEAEELEPQQQAYLIIGSLPSTSASLPLYRFTLTDRSPTVIAQSNAQ